MVANAAEATTRAAEPTSVYDMANKPAARMARQPPIATRALPISSHLRRPRSLSAPARAISATVDTRSATDPAAVPFITCNPAARRPKPPPIATRALPISSILSKPSTFSAPASRINAPAATIKPLADNAEVLGMNLSARVSAPSATAIPARPLTSSSQLS